MELEATVVRTRTGRGTMRNRLRSGQKSRRCPVGAEVLPVGGVEFRVWAPDSSSAAVLLAQPSDIAFASPETHEMEPEDQGYFRVTVPDAGPGMLYRIKLDTGAFPDPASRFQPAGPHGPSQIVDPSRFKWTDQKWEGVNRSGQVLYEMHIGTFTPEGTWAAATKQLDELASLGITVLEVMPVADFPGEFGWGYDGVDMFAPTRLYGTPDDMRAFVDRAHALGIGVILDVVYNHFGPDGNYWSKFSKTYFATRYKNEWGEALNFDDTGSGPVREFFISNAVYWVTEFHIDGLRLDATQQIFDSSSEHVIAAIAREVRAAAEPRQAYLVGENEPQQTILIRSPKKGGYDLDALWNDDFHHSAKVAMTGRSEAYFMDYRGAPQEFISMMKYGYLYQGQWYAWQKQTRGSSALDLDPVQFINFIQNHDQVANSLRGFRIHQLTGPGRYRAMTALMLLAPGTPMLFQGQEFAASAPFLYFAHHNPDLSKLVASGRREFLEQFPTIADKDSTSYLADPSARGTFERCKLDLNERTTHADIYSLHRDLLRLRKNDRVLNGTGRRGLDGAVLGPEALVLRLFAKDGSDRVLLVNFGLDLPLRPVPEPLLAPPRGMRWSLEWCSENPRYGGSGVTPLKRDDKWILQGQSAVLLVPEPNDSDEPAGTTN